MDDKTSPLIVDHLICPAFVVENGIIIQVNEAAAQRGIQLNTPVAELIRIGSEEYAAYNEGQLYLSLNICGTDHHASVTKAETRHIFCLESEYEEPELRAFALAAQELRAPLSTAMTETAQLIPYDEIQHDPKVADHMRKLNRSLYQLLRAVSNMSDAAHYTGNGNRNLQSQDIIWFLDEMLQKVTVLVQQTGKTLEYTLPKLSIPCSFDSEKIERAIHNLVSNAIKFSPAQSAIKIEIKVIQDRLYFIIENEASSSTPVIQNNIFNQFTREPGLEHPFRGIGLGMSIIRSVAAMHGGTVLLENTARNTLRITMTISAKPAGSIILRTPVKLLADYAGGHDHAIVELSDVLPSSLFDN